MAGRLAWWLRDHLGAVALAALLVPAVVLTALRPADVAWGPAVRATSFVPYALPLYAAALVVAGIRHVRWRTRLRLVPAVLALAGLALHGWWLAPYWLGANPPPARDADPVVVVTSNLSRGEGDALGLVELVSHEDADLLVVNEVSPGALRELRSGGLEEVLPYSIGQPDPEDATVGTMVFSRLPLSEPRRLDTRPGSWKVDVGGPGGLTLVAAHPSTPLSVADWRRDHRTIRRAAVRAGADLVVGDLNATLDHAPLRRLVAAGFRDAVELANEGFQPTWPANGLGPLGFLPPLVQIDHVLLGSDLAALSARTVALGGTDHRAVVAVLARQ